MVVKAGEGEGLITKGQREGLLGVMELLCVLIVAVVIGLYAFVEAPRVVTIKRENPTGVNYTPSTCPPWDSALPAGEEICAEGRKAGLLGEGTA